jgi:thymidylate synthase
LIPDIPPGLGIPPPTDMNYINMYSNRYLMSDLREEGEQYTYGERITKARISVIEHIERAQTFLGIDPPEFVNQIDEIIFRYKKYGPGNNQLILQVGQPADIMLKDPPCLRQIDTRVEEGKLHFVAVYFRSWDLWGGLPSNVAGIQLLKEYMAREIGVEDGEMICVSKGLHLYDHCWEIAGRRRGLSEEEIEKLKEIPH